MPNIIVSLHPQAYQTKPNKKDVALLSKEIALCSGEVVFGDFVEAIERGQTFAPGLFERERKNEAWRGATTLAIDIDNNADGKVLSIEESLDLCAQYELPPAVIYPSFSHTAAHPKYRMLWVLDQPLHYVEEFHAAMESLKRLFPLDRAAATLATMFYGTNKEVYHADERAVISLGELISAAEARVLQQSSGENRSRDLSRFRERVKVPNGRDHDTALIYIRGVSPTLPFHHFTPANRTLRSVPLDDLLSRCLLVREMYEGHNPGYYARWGVMSNLLCLRGGETLFLDLISRCCTDQHQHVKAELNIKDYKARGYKPMSCDHYCPHSDECIRSSNLISTARLYNRDVHRKPAQPPVSIEEASATLSTIVSDIYTSPDHDIHLVLADCGIGKTEAILGLEGVLIAAPTHRLKEEIAQRIQSSGGDVYVIPPLPDDLDGKHREAIERLYKTGAAFAAHAYLRRLAYGGDPSIRKYLEAIDGVPSYMTTVTTHARALSQPYPHRAIIFDEDPLLNGLLPISTAKMTDLLKFQRALNLKSADDCFALGDFVDYIRTSPIRMMRDTPVLSLKRWRSLITEATRAIAAGDYDSAVVSMLFSTHFVKTDENTILFISRQNLPVSRKVIILSATASPDIYRLLYGDRIRVHRVPHVAYRGVLIQHRVPFSRSYIRSKPEALQELAATLGDTPVITFKEHAHLFRNCVAHFGALEGLDTISGDLAVIGTPHLPSEVYALLSYAMGRGRTTTATMGYTQVEDENYRFWFPSYDSDADMRELQLWAVRSQLEQAIGRARLTRTRYHVDVYSNYPIRGAMSSTDLF